jgi:hypothetical protein
VTWGGGVAGSVTSKQVAQPPLKNHFIDQRTRFVNGCFKNFDIGMFFFIAIA